MNSQQTIELIYELIRNKNHLLKRALEENNDATTGKRLKNNEHKEITLPNFQLEFDFFESVSSVPIQTQSRIRISKFLYSFKTDPCKLYKHDIIFNAFLLLRLVSNGIIKIFIKQ